MANAKAPSRGDSITINFGLVSIPVKVMNGIDEDATKITRNRYTPDGNRASMQNVDSETGKVFAVSEMTMKYTTEQGVIIDLSDEEIAAAMGVENGDSELVGIYPLSELRKYDQAGPAQIRPQTMKVGSKTTRPYDKAFALFMGALEDAESFALVRYVTRGKPKIMAVFGDGRAAHLHWSNEVREQAAMPIVEVSEKESAMAKQLLETLMDCTAPLPIDNEAVEAVRTYAELKAKGEQPAAKAQEKVSTADDLMAMLEASLTVNK